MSVRRSLLAGPVLDVAPKLLGMVLRSTTDEGTVAVRLTEVEAYDGPSDPGSHAYRGQTPRNTVMFGPAGFLYVYFTYGMHFCMNVSAGPDGQPSAVLLRAGEIVEGLDLARARRLPSTPAGKFNHSTGVRPAGVRSVGVPSAGANGVLPGPVAKRPNGNPDRDLARGPARMCMALGIGRDDNGADLLSRTSHIQLLPGPGFDGEPATGPRVGLREAAGRPWRFWIPDDPTVSPYRPHVPKRRA
ncbi:DNA-3-methyladenine glycosylase [Kribbella turkmenica]|uniref:Putative 3-methyladenine DNA glycosylase n=1 Tax=Kribbella turkmenica TaxID=2530375 RepID=A0A4R4WSN6_9ACTN|nr:DNA-3-methyladenine glycosylase [Kribbella turkmenica]TDD20586.1 DNA-3-methyladenine glycosylase [Kribbella turkmenica]